VVRAHREAADLEVVTEPIPVAKPGHPEVNTQAVAFALKLMRDEGLTQAEACRRAVEEHFSDYHDPQGKAKSLAATIRKKRQEQRKQ
jgi:hypothetical protein